MSYHLGSVEPDQPADGYAAPPPRRSLVAVLLAVAVMAAFALALWLAYRVGANHRGGFDSVPLLRAEPGPTRIKPENPGGMPVPDRDMLIFKDARPKVERLLPPPEAPLPRPAPPPAAATPVAAVPPTIAITPPAAGVAPPPAAGVAPPTAAPASPPAVAPPQAAPVPAPAPATAGVRLQFGALRSEAAATHEWQRIKHANSDVLGKLEAGIVRADLGDKGTFWRIESKPVADPIAALQLCETLKRRNVGCVIAR